MTTYYFAGRHSRHAELTRYRDQLLTAVPGASVTSRWIDRHGGELETNHTPEALNAAPADCWKHGAADLEDLNRADVIVSFTDGGPGRRGEYHVEYGYALALRGSNDPRVYQPRIIVVGPRENIFHCHPAIEIYPEWWDFLRHEVILVGRERADALHPGVIAADDPVRRM